MADVPRQLLGLDEDGFISIKALKEAYRRDRARVAKLIGQTPALVVQGKTGEARSGAMLQTLRIDPTGPTSRFGDGVEAPEAYAGHVALLCKRPGNPFADMVSLGRTRTCDITVAMKTVSKLHAYFMRGDQGWELTDQRSTNGTYVNGEVLEPTKPYPLRDGDTIRLGEGISVMFRRAESFVTTELDGP